LLTEVDPLTKIRTSTVDAVTINNDLTEVERAFAELKDETWASS